MSAIIEDLKHFRMTLGPDAQHLLAQEREEEMILYLIKNRMILCEGIVDEETDKFVKKEDRFTMKWTTDRIFDARFKVTPLGLGGSDDEDANAHRLFDQGALHRGKKILRHAQAIDGALVHVNVFELPETPASGAPGRGARAGTGRTITRAIRGAEAHRRRPGLDEGLRHYPI